LQQLMDITPAAISTCASLRIAPKRKIGICRDVGRVLEAGAVNAADYIGRGAEKSKNATNSNHGLPVSVVLTNARGKPFSTDCSGPEIRIALTKR